MNSEKLEDIKLSKKSVAFLVISNEQSEKEIKKKIPFITASKRIKYLGRYNQDDPRLIS